MLAAEKVEEFRQSWCPTPEKVDLAIKTAIEVAHPSRVFLFGSWERGEATADSDLDLAVLVPAERMNEIPELRRQISRQLEPMRMSVDLILVTEEYFAKFRSSINSIYYKIAHQGKLVYGSELDPWAEKLLLKATEDETAIQIAAMPDGPFGFHAQQAVEKLITALLSQLSIAFDYTDDISKLALQLEEASEKLPVVPVALSELNKFAVVYRYDSTPNLEIPHRPAVIETVRLIREHIHARIVALSGSPLPPPLQ